MRNHALSAVLSLFLYVPTSITWAQTISTQKGLTTAKFQTQQGVLKIYLPDDMRPGDIISGTVEVIPKGTNTKQLEKNLAQLSNYSLSINGASMTLRGNSKTFLCTLKGEEKFEIQLILFREGSIIERISIPFTSSQNNADCNAPAVTLCGSPLRITGPFDGNMDNTKCSVGAINPAIIAESPRQCIIAFPEEAKGIHEIRVNENGIEKCVQKIAGVDLRVSAGKLNLLKGESTNLLVQVSGLENLHGRAILTINNTTRETVNLSNGNLQVIPVWPSPKGEFSVTNLVVSKTSGVFSVDVDLDLPDFPIQAELKPLPSPRNLEKEAILFGLSKAWKDAYTDMIGSGTRNELENCSACAKCIQSTVDEVKVNLVEKLGSGIVETFSSKGIGLVGGWLERTKKWIDRGINAKEIIEALIKAGNLQVVVFDEKMCGYCLFSGIVFYETGTGCVEATFWCKGGQLCCDRAETEVHISYCTDERGYATGKPQVLVKKK